MATVASHALAGDTVLLSLTLSDGTDLDINYALPGLDLLPITSGDQVSVEATDAPCFECNCWTGPVVILRDTSGVLLGAMWDAPDSTLPILPELTLSYRVEERADESGCGLHHMKTLLVSTGNGSSYEIPAGASTVIGNVRVGDGRSWIVFDQDGCVDGPYGWSIGYVVSMQ